MDPVLALAIFAMGLAFGSFLNVCIYRLPRGLSVVFPGSACPDCEQPIRFYDNVPVLSWLILWWSLPGLQSSHLAARPGSGATDRSHVSGLLRAFWVDGGDAEVLRSRISVAGPDLHRC